MANSSRSAKVVKANSNQSNASTTLPATNNIDRFSKIIAKLKRLKGAIVAIAGVGAVASGLVGYYTTYKTVTVAATPASLSSIANAGALSILVLPFANQTGDAQKSYIADALTTSITSDLSRIRDAFVIPPATAFSYKDKALTVQQIGKDAGVRFVLQGSVLSSSDKVRINVTLADAQNGATLWTDTLDGDLGNLFAMQDQVTARIGNSIGREMVIVAARDSETRRSSPKVADLMLRATALRLKTQTLETHQKREALLRQVLVLEPQHAAATADLAYRLGLQAYNFGTDMDHDAMERVWGEARDLASKVKLLDPDNPAVYYVAGAYASTHDDFSGWRRAAEENLALRPKSSTAYNNLAIWFIANVEPARAIELLTQAINLDPKHPVEVIFSNMARAHLMLDDNDAALAWCLKGTAAHPANPECYAILAMVYAAEGDARKLDAALGDLRRVAPRFKVSQKRKPQASSPAAYKTYYETKFLPMWRKAGLPE
ncbi:MAG: tetratricopeptide repeat protein [Pseudomonadota bacterium]